MRNLNYEHCRTIQKEFYISTRYSFCISSERLLALEYIVNLTDTINDNQNQIVNLQKDLTAAQEKITDQNTRLTSAESTWQMAENLYRQLADQVREHSYDIKDLNR